MTDRAASRWGGWRRADDARHVQGNARLHLTIEDMIAEGDKVVCRNIWRWTDSPSGKKIQFHGFVLWRFEGDKIAERWATVTSPAEGGLVDC
jgi:predicted ester cyclase